MDHHHDLTDAVYAHLGRRRDVVNVIHNLDLGVVISGAQSAHLRKAALLSASADFVRVRVEHAAVLLAMFLVLRPGVALAQAPVHAHLQRRLQAFGGGGDDALAPDPHRDVVEERLRQSLFHVRHVLLHQVGADDAHAAVYVEAHPPGRHHRGRVGHVEGGDVPDGEPVAGVHVRQRDGRPHHPRQRRHVRDLFHRGRVPSPASIFVAVRAQFVQDELAQAFVDVNFSRHAHVRHETFRDDELRRRHRADVRALLVVRATRVGVGAGRHGARATRAASRSRESIPTAARHKATPTRARRRPRAMKVQFKTL